MQHGHVLITFGNLFLNVLMVSVIDSKEIRIRNQLVHKRTPNHLDKLECRFTLKRVRDMIITFSYVSICFLKALIVIFEELF